MKLVTAVMAARGRVSWAQQSLNCFLAQTYDSKSIVIIDDEDEPAFPQGVDHRSVYYSRLNIRYNIPQKLNMACEIARHADIISKWDSDDWYAPTRIEEQVTRLDKTDKAVTGCNWLKFFDTETGKAYEYRTKAPYALGTSLTFLRSFWESNRFPENKFTGSDNKFVRAARDANQLDYLPADQMIVARIHDGNTSKKQGYRRGPEYHSIELNELPADFLALERVLA